ncbi:MAG: hypothetical protein CSA33_01275 [Desulfobulbus propionicus]|nr:MAG: hypothetical protein CSA33_01275 [Desulfobulbus propionicus]
MFPFSEPCLANSQALFWHRVRFGLKRKKAQDSLHQRVAVPFAFPYILFVHNACLLCVKGLAEEKFFLICVPISCVLAASSNLGSEEKVVTGSCGPQEQGAGK